MAEPARKFNDIEPDIKPNFGVINGGGNTTPDRATLRSIEKQESNPEQINNDDDISKKESEGSNVIQGPWKNNVNNTKIISKKKKGPLTAILITLIGGGIGVGGLLSPSLLIVNLKEVLVNKFNTQLTSMDIRTTKILSSKMGTTKGICGSVISIACKYSTLSEKQMANFEKAGIKVTYDKTTITGRSKPTSFEFEGKSIKASEFSSELSNSTEFRSAIKKAYNPKFAGFDDGTWKKATSKLKFTEKAATIEGDTDEAKLKSIQDDIKGTDISSDNDIKTIENGDKKPDGTEYSAEEIAAANDAASETSEIFDSADSAATRTGSEILEVTDDIVESTGEVASKSLSGMTNTIKITGFADNACTVYGTVQAVGYAAKTVRAAQLARYAMLFLNVADQIKAGDAKAEDVEYLGKILTTEVAATATTKKIGSATDSFGYKYAAYGETGKMSTSASKFLAGGGLTGSLIGITSFINQKIGGAPKKTCGILKNPFVSTASLVAGVVTLFIPGGIVAIGAKDVAQGIGAIAFNIAAMALPGLLKDIVAGKLIDENSFGEASGDAIVSGASGIMSSSAGLGGNAPLTPKQAVAYNNLSNNIAAEYAEEDRLAYSPLDPTNSNTFMGKIFSQLTPYVSKMSSLSGILTSVASLSIGSFASITSDSTKATDTEAEYEMCQDIDYRDMNIATDPYCNVVYGVPTEALDEDPTAVLNALSGQVDTETGAAVSGSEYEKFLNNCINRKLPLGSVNDDFQESDGYECKFDNSNKNYYLFYIDQRVLNGMEGEDEKESTSSNNTKPSNTTPAGSGWTLTDNTDYSGTVCAAGSTDQGIYKHPTKGFTIRLCKIDGIGKVNSVVSNNIINMVKDAAKSGLTLTATNSFRSYEAQVAAHKAKPDITATPGSSQHEKGLALDFDNGTSDWDAKFTWLQANAAKYNYINLKSEPWHWSTSGW